MAFGIPMVGFRGFAGIVSSFALEAGVRATSSVAGNFPGCSDRAIQILRALEQNGPNQVLRHPLFRSTRDFTATVWNDKK